MDHAPDFTPAPSRRRIAGWTPARQTAFINALADGHSVCDAAARVGLSARSAYKLRAAPGGSDFAAVWDTALLASATRLHETALERALRGEQQPVVYRGTVVGARTVHDNRLLIALLDRHFSTRRKSVGV